MPVLNFPIGRESKAVPSFFEERGAEIRDSIGKQPIQEMPWHVLHVRSNFERRVAKHLTARAVEHYLPLYRERVKWTDRAVITERPLFSGYVFARFSLESRIAAISVPGVVRSLGDDEGHLVRYAELEKIRQGLASGLLLRPHPTVSIGARVRIRGGIFEGMEGLVTEFRQQCKVVIALAAVQQCFSLEVELRDIEVMKKGVASVDPLSRVNCNYWSLQAEKP